MYIKRPSVDVSPHVRLLSRLGRAHRSAASSSSSREELRGSVTRGHSAALNRGMIRTFQFAKLFLKFRHSSPPNDSRLECVSLVSRSKQIYLASLPQQFLDISRVPGRFLLPCGVARKRAWYRDCFTSEYSKGNATGKRVRVYRDTYKFPPWARDSASSFMRNVAGSLKLKSRKVPRL